MGLRDSRLQFKPFEYEIFYDYWKMHEQSHWLHYEISMNKDIKDWCENLSEFEKEVVGKILKGFAITETFVGDYWSTFVAQVFPKPEIVLMCNSFCARESIHAIAYNYLNEILNLNDFDSFLTDETTMTKLEVLMNSNKSDSDENVARALALFSAGVEGVSLMSSFSILMSFRLSNKLKGISQQMLYSVKDESLHSTAGCLLFRELIKEKPEIWTKTLQNEIYDGMDLILTNEFNFIDSVFENGELENLNKEQLKNYMKHRANIKLDELLLKQVYEVDETLLEEMSWFKNMISGEQDTDFFDGKSVNYAKANSDWNEDIF
jgi:ribonucleoside-diphosphate reductase beta chain